MTKWQYLSQSHKHPFLCWIFCRLTCLLLGQILNERPFAAVRTWNIHETVWNCIAYFRLPVTLLDIQSDCLHQTSENNFRSTISVKLYKTSLRIWKLRFLHNFRSKLFVYITFNKLLVTLIFIPFICSGTWTVNNCEQWTTNNRIKYRK